MRLPQLPWQLRSILRKARGKPPFNIHPSLPNKKKLPDPIQITKAKPRGKARMGKVQVNRKQR